MSRTRVVLKRLGRILKFAIFCILLTVIILLMWRVFSTGIPKEMKAISTNERVISAYADGGGELYVFEQNYDPITRDSKNSGYFSVPQAHFIPDANQAQIVFRYNNSTITNVAEDYELSAVPSREQEMFDVSLLVYIDLTPENSEDNFMDSATVADNTYYNDTFINPETSKVVRLKPSGKTSAKTTLYNFYKYEFNFDDGEEDLDLSELLEDNSIIAIHTEIYYNDDIDYSEEAYGAIRIFDQRAEKETVKLSKKERSSLAD